VAVDFLGFHDDRRDGINDDIFQSAFGIKWNPFGQLVASANVQIPLNGAGLRADWIPSFQLEFVY
jgi:hypothetical protein